MPRPPSPDGYPTMCLALLASGPAHGYDLVQRMAERTGDELLLPAGLVYAILHALERGGLADASWDPGPGARRRRIYRLTDRGRRVLEERRIQWQRHREAVDRVLGVDPGGAAPAAPEGAV